MTVNDDKRLLWLFVGIGIFLVGGMFLNLWFQARSSTGSIESAKRVFVTELPKDFVTSVSGISLQEIVEDEEGLAELVFGYRGTTPIPEIISALERLLARQYSIVNRMKGERLMALGISYHGFPVGRIIIRRDLPPAIARIGIIIDDFGYSHNAVVKGFLDLPTNLAFAIIPGHRYSRDIGSAAAARGFDVMIHMPMEPEKYTHGEEQFILRPGMSSRQVINRMQKAFDALPMAVGLNNHQGSLATQDVELMQTVLHVLADRNMFFVDSYTTPKTVGFELANRLNIPAGKRAIFLDNEQDTTYIKQQLKQLVDEAKRKKIAIGIGHNKKLTLRVLQQYIPYYEAHGIHFTRISELLRSDRPVL